MKGMVKEMDGDEFYSRPDVYDESAEVWKLISISPVCKLQPAGREFFP